MRGKSLRSWLNMVVGKERVQVLERGTSRHQGPKARARGRTARAKEASGCIKTQMMQAMASRKKQRRVQQQMTQQQIKPGGMAGKRLQAPHLEGARGKPTTLSEILAFGDRLVHGSDSSTVLISCGCMCAYTHLPVTFGSFHKLTSLTY